VAREKKEPPVGARSMMDALAYASPRPFPDAPSATKSAYAARLSNALAMVIANGLRTEFQGVLPAEDGSRLESRARSAKGFKKLDVNYSTPELGLALGVSIKTINYRDGTTKRYTKNYTARDNELRAEATDYHQRQPYSVLIGLLFLPYDSCDDAGVGAEGASSFGAAVRHFRLNRVLRVAPDHPPDLFEGFYVGLYEFEGVEAGRLDFFDVLRDPPRNRRPTEVEVMSLQDVLAAIRRTYDARNNPRFDWAP
jgi:hypothetical protein